MSHIPGEYPATPDEQPVTLSQRLRHPLATLGAGQHESNEHSKLQKAQDPRSHKHADSGVGIVDADPTLGGTQRLTESRPTELSADREVSGPSQGTSTSGGLHAIVSEPRPSAQEPRLFANDPHITTNEHNTTNEPHTTASTSSPKDSHDHVAAPLRVSTDGQGPVDDNHRDSTLNKDSTVNKDTGAPYWGNLPKAMSGGIYNTVMGHGSPKEDHAQHQNLPQKSAPSPARVSGDAVDFPKGGVYNTVAGHGSHDEETMRHNAPTGAFSENNQTGALGREPTHQHATSSGMAAAALPMSQPLSQHPESRGTAPSAGMVSTGMAGMGAPQQAPDAARTIDQTQSTSPRAFPLNSSHQDTRRQSADDAHVGQGYIVPAAAAGVAGAGVAAAHQADKPKKLQKPREASPNEEPRRRSMGPSSDRRAHPTRGLVTHAEGPARSPNRRSAPGSDSSSPVSSERKKHGILGIFHRHKDDKEEKANVAKEPTSDSHHNDHHRKQEAATAAAAGAGVYGLTKHHKDEKKDRHHSEPTATREDPYAPAKRLSANDHSAATQHQTSAAYGTLPPPIDENAARRSGNDVPVPPARSEKRRSASPTTMAAMTGGTVHHPHDSANDVQPQASRQSHDSASRYAPGVAAGLGASILAAGQDRSSASQGEALTSPVTFEHPRAPPSTPFDSNLAAGSKHHRSGSASSPRTAHPTTMVGDNTVTNAPGEYNTLHSGTASGVHSSLPPVTSRDAGVRAHTPPQSNPTAGSSDETPYNVLPSGTPSGVKIGSRSSRGSTDNATGTSDLTKDDSHHKGLASGAAAGMAATGLAASHAQNHHDRDETKNTPSVQHQESHQSRDHGSSFNMAPMPIRSKHPLPTVPDESKPNPTPDQAKNMSPEVMPEAYTSSTRSSEPRHHTLHHSPANPALAAAAGAWAASAGPSSGNTAHAGSGPMGSGSEKVSHKCGHCGGEEDITSEVKEAVKRIMQAKMKRGGKDGEIPGEESWWHDAWTSV